MAQTSTIQSISSRFLEVFTSRPTYSDSVGGALQIIKGRQFWEMIGPWLYIWESNQMNCLIHAADASLQSQNRLNERYPWGKGCFMIGSTRDTAKPFFFIWCENKKNASEAHRCLTESLCWKDFKQRFGAFGSGYGISSPYSGSMPKPQGKDALATTWDHFGEVYFNPEAKSACGMPIFFTSKGSFSHDQNNTSTLGGIIYIKDKPFGLSCAHSCAKGASVLTWKEKNLSESVGSDGSDMELNEGDDDGDQHDYKTFCAKYDDESQESSKDPIIGHSNSQMAAVSALVKEPQPNWSAFGPTHKLGTLYDASFLHEGNPNDWALFTLETSVQELCHAGNFVILPEKRKDPLFVTSWSRSPFTYRDVLVMTASKGLVKGQLAPAMVHVRIWPSSPFVLTQIVRLEKKTSKGDCGAWVIDAADGTAYGQIVAATGADNGCYAIPSIFIIQDLAKCMNIKEENMSLIPPSKTLSRKAGVSEEITGTFSSAFMHASTSLNTQTQEHERQISSPPSWHPVSYPSTFNDTYPRQLGVCYQIFTLDCVKDESGWWCRECGAYNVFAPLGFENFCLAMRQ